VTDLVHGDVGAIGELRTALDAFLRDATGAVAEAARAAERTLAEIDQELNARRAELSRLQAALDACRRDEQADCSGIERAVSHAAQRLELAAQACRLATQAIARFTPRRARFERECRSLVSEGGGLLMRQSGDLTRYLSAGAGSGGSAGFGGGPGTAATASMPAGWAMVPLSAIDTSDSRVEGDASFGKGYSPADLAWAFEALHEVVLPAMALGHGAGYFQQRDEGEGRLGARSYSDTYSGFFGDSSIKLERRADGTFAVANGYHRIWVATRLGLHAVPGRVR
jgi:hypothetical protein